MTARITVGLEGGLLLEQKLEALDRAARGDALADAARAGAERIHAAVNVPIGPGRRGKHLAQDLAVKLTATGDQHAEASVGFFGRTIAHLVEYGHQLVKGGTLKRGGRVVGHVPAHPFLRPAFDEQEDAAVAAVGDVLRRDVEQAAS